MISKYKIDCTCFKIDIKLPIFFMTKRADFVAFVVKLLLKHCQSDWDFFPFLCLIDDIAFVNIFLLCETLYKFEFSTYIK